MDKINAKIPKLKNSVAIGLTITEAIIPIGEQVPKPKRQIGDVISWAPREADKSELSFLDKSFVKNGIKFWPKYNPTKAP